MREAYFLFGKFWKIPDLAQKRQIFRAMVLEIGLTGLRAFVLTKADYAALDGVRNTLARKVMCGDACTQDAEHYKAMSTKDPHRHMKMVPALVQLRCYRMKWFQQWVRHPEEHIILLAAMFAAFDWERPNKPSWTEMGVAKTGHPWLHQLIEDLDFVANISPLADHREDACVDPRRFFLMKMHDVAFSSSTWM